MTECKSPDVPQYPNESPLDCYLLPDDAGDCSFMVVANTDSLATPNDAPAHIAATKDDPWLPIEAYLSRRLALQQPISASNGKRSQILPPFERNDNTLGFMTHYVQKHVEGDILALRLQRYFKELEHELLNQAQRQQSLVGEYFAVNGDPTSPLDRLSKHGAASLASLVDNATQLQLCSVRLSSFQLALTDLLCKHQNTLQQKETHERRLTELRTMKTTLEDQLSRAKNLCVALRERAPEEQAMTQQYHSQAQLLSAKKQEYYERLTTISQDQVSRLGPLRVKALQAIADKLTTQRQRYAKAQSLLRSYRDLPPDVTLARLKLTQAKHQLHELRMQRDNMMSHIASEML